MDGGREDAETSRRDYGKPHTGKNPIPTIQGYRDFKSNQRENLQHSNSSHAGTEGPATGQAPGIGGPDAHEDQRNDHSNKRIQDHDLEDTSQVVDTKQKHGHLGLGKKNKEDTRAERQVTDPVTHLPIKIRDFNNDDLKKSTDSDEESPDGELKSQKRSRAASIKSISTQKSVGKRGNQLQEDHEDQQSGHDELDWTFPPPSFQNAQEGLQRIYSRAVMMGVIVVALVGPLSFWASGMLVRLYTDQHRSIAGVIVVFALLAVITGVCGVVILGLRTWVQKKFQDMWEDEVRHIQGYRIAAVRLT